MPTERTGHSLQALCGALVSSSRELKNVNATTTAGNHSRKTDCLIRTIRQTSAEKGISSQCSECRLYSHGNCPLQTLTINPFTDNHLHDWLCFRSNRNELHVGHNEKEDVPRGLF